MGPALSWPSGEGSGAPNSRDGARGRSGARRWLLLGPVLVGLLAACWPAGPARQLTPPDSERPAAGICATAVGPVAVVTVEIDVPAPRCQRVRREQGLTVVNHTDEPVVARLGPLTLQIPPQAEQTITQPFGDYLAPGVHRLVISTYADSGAEVWVQG